MILVLSHCLKLVKGLESSGAPASSRATRRPWWPMRGKLCASRSANSLSFRCSPSLLTICNHLWQSSINRKCCVKLWTDRGCKKHFPKKENNIYIYRSGWRFVCLFKFSKLRCCPVELGSLEPTGAQANSFLMWLFRA